MTLDFDADTVLGHVYTLTMQTYSLNDDGTTSSVISTTDDIANNASANDFKGAISGFYSDNYGSTISVTKEMFDVSDVTTAVEADAVKIVYTVSVNRRFSGYNGNGESWDNL